MAEEIRIEFTRFSAFYSPLIATMAGGFLEQEGLRPRHSVSAPGKSAIAGLLDGSVHVAQSAPSQGFGPLEQGKQPPALTMVANLQSDHEALVRSLRADLETVMEKHNDAGTSDFLINLIAYNLIRIPKLLDRKSVV